MFGGPHEAADRHGYGGDVHAAWDRRKQVLAERGYVDDLGGGKYRGSRDLIQLALLLNFGPAVLVNFGPPLVLQPRVILVLPGARSGLERQGGFV